MYDLTSQPLEKRLDLLDEKSKDNVLNFITDWVGSGYADDFHEQVMDYLSNGDEYITTTDGTTYEFGEFFGKWDFTGRVWVETKFALDKEEV